MSYYFDNYGWLTAQEIPGRRTDVEPPVETDTLKANWTGVEWVLVEYVEPAHAQPVPAKRLLSKLGFRNRFSPTEKANLEIASLDNPAAPMPARMAAAGLRATLADQRDAEFIDPTRADTREGVTKLEQAGLIAAGRALQILDAPILDHEQFKG